MEKSSEEIKLKDILMTISEYIAYLLKNKIIIIAISFLFAIISLLFALTSEPEYNAELNFVVEGEGSSLSGLSNIASQFGFSSAKESSFFHEKNLIELLKTRKVVVNALMRKAVVDGKKKRLLDHYMSLQDIDVSESIYQDIFTSKNTYSRDSTTKLVYLNILQDLDIFYKSSDAEIMTLSYTSKNEEFAKEFVEVLIDELSRLYVFNKTEKANRDLTFLNNTLDSIYNELIVTETEYTRIQDLNLRIVKPSGRLKEMQLMREVQKLNAVYLEVVKNTEISKLTLRKKTPLVSVIDWPTLPLDEESYSIKISILLGAFLGFFLSTVYFVLRKLLRDSIRSDS